MSLAYIPTPLTLQPYFATFPRYAAFSPVQIATIIICCPSIPPSSSSTVPVLPLIFIPLLLTMSKKNDDRKNVIVVGGGFAGAAIASQLSKALNPAQFHLILINPLPFYTHRIAMVRMAVSDQDKLEDKAWIPFDRIFGEHKDKGTFLQGTVTSITSSKPQPGGEVTLADGQRVPYAALILAPGSNWKGPIYVPPSEDEAHKYLASQRSDFAHAQKIVIVGGGAVGLELAGEVKDIWPVRPQLSHRHTAADRPLNASRRKKSPLSMGLSMLNDTYTPRFRHKLENGLRARGVSFVLGDVVENMPLKAGSLTTRNGVKLTADYVVSSLVYFDYLGCN